MSLFPCGINYLCDSDKLFPQKVPMAFATFPCFECILPSWGRHQDLLPPEEPHVSATFVTVITQQHTMAPDSNASTRSSAKSSDGPSGTDRPSRSSKKFGCKPLETLHETDADDSCVPTPVGPAPPKHDGTLACAQTPTQSPHARAAAS